MNPITDYKILSDIMPDRFEKEAKKLLESGWQPFGGLIIIGATGDQIKDQLTQAFVKYENTDDDLHDIACSLRDITGKLGSIDESIDRK